MSALERATAIIELLANKPEGLPVTELAEHLDLPASGAHRLLKELEKLGYVSQNKAFGDYQLTIKLASIGLGFLGRAGITDISQPILDELARASKELVRISLFDGNNLVWVGVAQGATGGLRYDPGSEHGVIVHYASSAGGQAWLAEMSDDEALANVAKQGLIRSTEAGLKPPQTITELLKILKQTRKRGFSMNVDSYLPGMAAMAAVIKQPDTQTPIGTVSIAGPSVRMTPERMASYADLLLEAAKELGLASRASGYFTKKAKSLELAEVKN